MCSVFSLLTQHAFTWDHDPIYVFVVLYDAQTGTNGFEQAKPETVNKVCEIVRKQLALPADSAVTGESKFQALGADSLDTVCNTYL